MKNYMMLKKMIGSIKGVKTLKPSIQETVRNFRMMVASKVDKKNGYLTVFADILSFNVPKMG